MALGTELARSARQLPRRGRAVAAAGRLRLQGSSLRSVRPSDPTLKALGVFTPPALGLSSLWF
jgi:hypothetical protein